MNRRLTNSRWVDCCCRAYHWTCRVFGVLTAIGLWGIGAEALYDKHPLGIYFLVVAAVVSFTELIYFVHFWLALFIGRGRHPCLALWNCLLWVDNWKKGILYLSLSVGCFVSPQQFWMALISGAMLVITSLLYFLKTFSDRAQTQESAETGPKTMYNRFEERIDELTETFEETEVNEDEFASTLPSFGLAGQEEILTV